MSPFSLGVLGSAHVPAAGGGVVSDTFTRADNASSLGTADTGQAWTANSGTWGITSNAAYSTTTNATPWATLPAWSDVEVTVTVNGLAGYPAVIARAVDGATRTHYSALWNPDTYPAGAASGIELRRIVAGVDTALGYWNSTTLPATVTLRVTEGIGQTDLEVLVDGVSRITYADTAGSRPNGTRAGIAKGWGTNVARFDDFTATEL